MSYRYIIFFSIISFIFILLDIYCWKGFKTKDKFRYLKFIIPFSSLLFILSFIFTLWRAKQGIFSATFTLNFLLGITFGFFLSKLLCTFIFILEDTYRIFSYTFRSIINRKSPKSIEFPQRRRFIRNMAFSVASIPLLGSIYAITRGKYNYQVKELNLAFKNLPEAFEGFKIGLFSDFHAGSFDDINMVEKGLDLFNEYSPNIIAFTGDLVNNRPIEAEPYQQLLKNMKASYGKFAILGNHDYGDYIPFENEEKRNENLQKLENIHLESGFRLLKNEHVQIQKGDSKIAIIGVENWGRDPFPQYGDIEKATNGLESDTFKVLLSHDPDHWEYQIKDLNIPVDLTLSGHTHGAQFGVNIPNWKWSPAKYRYKRWLGLYKENNKYLFVSKGFGFLGFPGRIGMSPEIVIIKLVKE